MLLTHCIIEFHEKSNVYSLRKFSYVISVKCSKCKKYSIFLVITEKELEDTEAVELIGLDSSNIDYGSVGIRRPRRSIIARNNTDEIEKFEITESDIIFKGRVYPKGCSFPAPPPEVPKEIADDYNEACLVLNDSPNASAALSRRCLQNLIRKYCNIKKRGLELETDHFIEEKKPPNHIIENLDYLRKIGNYAAHPIKDEETGIIIPVDLEEAEWNLIVLQDLFDFCYVQPAKQKKSKKHIIKNGKKKYQIINGSRGIFNSIYKKEKKKIIGCYMIYPSVIDLMA